MSTQPGYQNSGYKFFDAAFIGMGKLSQGPISEWPEEERNAAYDAFKNGFEKLQDEVADAKQNGKQAFVKEHTLLLLGPDKWFSDFYKDDKVEMLQLHDRENPLSPHTNPTNLPDSFLLNMQPIFQIRHPGLMFPSMLRVQSKAFEGRNISEPSIYSTFTLSPSRKLYDWYRLNASYWKPKVIDADDIMDDPNVVRQLCLETNLDPDAVKYEWEERHDDNPLVASFLSTIYASKGIVKGLDARTLDLAAEKVKWKQEFGDEDGEKMAQFVDDAMPDYNYLLTQRVRAA
ncbi:hypothetical protein DE146DRAFT_677638 [Phaeosphaeria sp. MPI-PUGE-AT-0046c]|nr:hypothetical protein DE146DRAFT_677638 [Phaeosphaeria sp. MPI-PUGE-AT-0046c]